MKDMNFHDIPEKLMELVARAKHYAPLLFCVFVALVYGALVYRVQVLNSREPSSADVATQSQTAKVPHISSAVLNQLQQLQDNSVNVQSLFNEARSNPFQE